MRALGALVLISSISGCCSIHSGMAASLWSLQSAMDQHAHDSAKKPRMEFATAEKNAMLAEVMKYLTIGMPMTEARETLAGNGFWAVSSFSSDGVVEKEIYRRSRPSGKVLSQWLSPEVILLTLHLDGAKLRNVSLRYFDRDPELMTDEASAAVYASEITPESIPSDWPTAKSILR